MAQRRSAADGARSDPHSRSAVEMAATVSSEYGHSLVDKHREGSATSDEVDHPKCAYGPPSARHPLRVYITPSMTVLDPLRLRYTMGSIVTKAKDLWVWAVMREIELSTPLQIDSEGGRWAGLAERRRPRHRRVPDAIAAHWRRD